MGEGRIPGLNESVDVARELLNRAEVAVAETLASEDAEPDFRHIQPGGVEREEVNDDAFVIGLEPRAALLARFQVRIVHPTEIGYRLHEVVIIVMRGKIVHDVMKGRLVRKRCDMIAEDLDERVPIVIRGALAANVAAS